MKNFYESDYAINKRSKNIVYRFTDGDTEVTLEAYLTENPGKTVEDFREIKAVSDEIYHNQDIEGQRQTRKNISLHSSPEIDRHSVPSIEAQLEAQLDNQITQRRMLAVDVFILCGNLTPTQRRRFILFCQNLSSTRKIAQVEGVDRRAVWDSLQSCKKKFEKFCKKYLRTPPDF